MNSKHKTKNKVLKYLATEEEYLESTDRSNMEKKNVVYNLHTQEKDEIAAISFQL